MVEPVELHTAWDVDRRIVLDSEEKLVLVRFSSYASSSEEIADYYRQQEHRHNGSAPDALDATTAAQAQSRKRTREGDDTAASVLLNNVDEHFLLTRQMDAVLRDLAPKVRKFCTVFFVDTRKVTAFNDLYELGHNRDPFAVMFFYRNRHIRVDLGTGNNNKVNFYAFEDLNDFLPIVLAAYKAGKQGRHITSCDKKFTTVALRR